MEVELASTDNVKQHNQTSKKLTLFLNTLLKPELIIDNDKSLCQLLDFLIGDKSDSDKTSECSGKNTGKEFNEELSQWLIKAVKIWEEQKNEPVKTILDFTLKLAGILSTDEQIFVCLNGKNVYETLVGMAQKNVSSDPSITIGFETLLISFLQHKSGLQWVIATTYWVDVIKLGIKSSNIQIKQNAYLFLATLLQKTISFNKKFCISLVGILVKPLQEALKKYHVDKEANIYDVLNPNLTFICAVAEIILKSHDGLVLDIFLELQTQEIANKLLIFSHNEDLSFKLIKLTCIFSFYKFYKIQNKACIGGRSDIKRMIDIVQQEICKGHTRCVLKICHYANTLYCSMPHPIPPYMGEGEPVEFQNQLMFLLMMPILAYVSKKTQINLEDTMTNIYRREFMHKLMKMSTSKVMGIGYRWKARVSDRPEYLEDLILSLEYLQEATKVLNKEMAAFFFQPLISCLKKNLEIMDEDESLSPSYELFLTSLISTIIKFAQTFDLTWKDTFISISVMSMACQFLQFSHLNDKLIISGLQLLNLAILKDMSPDMVLLMDNSPDSCVSITVSILRSKCCENNVAIQEAALETVHALAINANSTFRSYADVLLSAEMPQLVVQMALKNNESRVRVGAFRCLQELLQIEDNWHIFMKLDSFLDDILSVLERETEINVRKEVALVVKNIYKYQSFPDEMLPRLYDVMTQTATGDSSCTRTKCHSVCFWFTVIEKHLNNEGMIDRKFPEVTFSKEQRKIVTLNQKEVHKRLKKVLNEMSRIGCLYVLKYACLDTDEGVSKKAREGTLLIVEMLKHYEVSPESVSFDGPTNPTTPISQNMPVSYSTSPASSGTLSVSEIDFGNSKNEFIEPISPFSCILSPPDSLTLELDSGMSPGSFNPAYRDFDIDMLGDYTANQINHDETQKDITCEKHLAPSEYLKFIYHLKPYDPQGKQKADESNAFVFHLDRILQEYNIIFEST